MIKAFKRSQSSLIREGSEKRIKFFHRYRGDDKNSQLYQQGTLGIIGVRRLINMRKDTMFLALDMFKKSLQTDPVQERTLEAVCISVIHIAAKLNESQKLQIYDIIESMDSFVKKEEILAMESYILNTQEFHIPFEINILSLLHDYLPENITLINKCVKIIMECISDPFFMKIENEQIVKASICYVCVEQAKKLGFSIKDFIPIIIKLKRTKKEDRRRKEQERTC